MPLDDQGHLVGVAALRVLRLLDPVLEAHPVLVGEVGLLVEVQVELGKLLLEKLVNRCGAKHV